MPPEKDNILQLKRLANETEYFNNVFKKTEKLISVTFYILSHINYSSYHETQVTLIKDRALKTHEEALATLRLQTHEASEGLLSFQHALVSLESTLRIAEAAGVVPGSITELLFGQILTIERYLSHHYLSLPSISLSDMSMISDGSSSRTNEKKTTSTARTTPSTPRRRPVHIPGNDISSDAYLVYSHLTDRAERIKTVLEAKPQATIRDIAEIITDVSEKTIQRELNRLIEKGQVIREGERRWSKYSVKK